MPKKPEPAPSGPLSPDEYKKLEWNFTLGKLDALLERASRRYLYWDRVKHLTMPQDVRPEEAWRLVKLLRQSNRTQTEVRDVGGHEFSYTMTPEIMRCLHVIDRQTGGTVTSPREAIPKAEQQRYIVNSLMEEAIASSQIEGAATTRQAGKEMLRQRRNPASRAERMILNNYQTITRIGELRDDPVTPELILELQEQLTQGTLDNPDDCGRFRTTDDIRIMDSTHEILHEPPKASEVSLGIQLLCVYANREGPEFEHPVIKAAVLHFWLAYLHPFVDGNGRTARALFHLFMLKQGYWLFEYLPISRVILHKRTQYEKAFLHSEVDDADMTYFLTFHLQAIEEALNSLWQYIERKTEEDSVLRAQLQRDAALNHRQRAVLSRALRDSATLFTVESHRTSQGVAYATARHDLLDLAEKGYLTKSRAGRAFVFVATDDLRSRLARSGRRDISR